MAMDQSDPGAMIPPCIINFVLSEEKIPLSYVVGGMIVLVYNNKGHTPISFLAYFSCN
jgi:hypothetical protein